MPVKIKTPSTQLNAKNLGVLIAIKGIEEVCLNLCVSPALI